MNVFGKLEKQLGYVKEELNKVREIVGDLDQYKLSQKELKEIGEHKKGWVFHPTLKITRCGVELKAIVSLGSAFADRGEIGGFLNPAETFLSEDSWVNYPSLFYSGRCEEKSVVEKSIVKNRSVVCDRAEVVASFLINCSVDSKSLVMDSFCANSSFFEKSQIEASFVSKSIATNSVAYMSKIEKVALRDFSYINLSVAFNVFFRGTYCISSVVKGPKGLTRHIEVCEKKLPKNSYVKNYKDVASVGPIGTDNRTLYLSKTTDGCLILKTGCFNGSYPEFMKKSSIAHKNIPEISETYKTVIHALAKTMNAKLEKSKYI